MNIGALLPVLKIITLSGVFFVWFIRYDNIVKEFEKYGYSSKIRDLVGVLKISSVLMIQSESTFQIQMGSGILAFLMLVAFGTHLKVKNPVIEFIPSFIFLIFSILFFVSA